MRAFAFAFCSAFAVFYGEIDGWASGPDPVKADTLFREGRVDAEAGDYAAACPKFEESYRLDPAPGTLLNLGDCEENRGRLAHAWQHFRRLYETLPATDDRKPIAEARAHALEVRAPKLRIVLTGDPAANVSRDGILLSRGALGASIPVDPGRHVIVVSAVGRHDRRYEVSLNEAENKDISVTVGDVTSGATSPSPRASAGSPVLTSTLSSPDHERHTQRTAGFIVGGVGAASILAGTVFGGVALSQFSSGPQASMDNRSAHSWMIATETALGVGLVLIGTAVVLLVTTKQPTSPWVNGQF